MLLLNIKHTVKLLLAEFNVTSLSLNRPFFSNLILFISTDFNSGALDATYQGCWTDQESNPDLPYLIWSDATDILVSRCIHDCNARGFDFAGLQVSFCERKRTRVMHMFNILSKETKS